LVQEDVESLGLRIHGVDLTQAEEREADENHQHEGDHLLDRVVREHLAHTGLLHHPLLLDLEFLFTHPVALQSDQGVVVVVSLFYQIAVIVNPLLLGVPLQLDNSDQPGQPDDTDDSSGPTHLGGLGGL